MRALLFTDIEGSTALLQRIGLRYTTLLRRHQDIILDAVSSYGGTVEREEGDGLFVTFASPSAGIAAAAAAQVRLQREPWPSDARVRVRMGVHVGEIADTSAGLVGLPIHHAARIAAVAQGEQILVSDAARWLAEDVSEPVGLRNLGHHQLRDLGRAVLHQVTHPELRDSFPAAIETVCEQAPRTPDLAHGA